MDYIQEGTKKFAPVLAHFFKMCYLSFKRIFSVPTMSAFFSSYGLGEISYRAIPRRPLVHQYSTCKVYFSFGSVAIFVEQGRTHLQHNFLTYGQSQKKGLVWMCSLLSSTNCSFSLGEPPPPPGTSLHIRPPIFWIYSGIWLVMNQGLGA